MRARTRMRFRAKLPTRYCIAESGRCGARGLRRGPNGELAPGVSFPYRTSRIVSRVSIARAVRQIRDLTPAKISIAEVACAQRKKKKRKENLKIPILHRKMIDVRADEAKIELSVCHRDFSVSFFLNHIWRVTQTDFVTEELFPSRRKFEK